MTLTLAEGHFRKYSKGKQAKLLGKNSIGFLFKCFPDKRTFVAKQIMTVRSQKQKYCKKPLHVSSDRFQNKFSLWHYLCKFEHWSVHI